MHERLPHRQICDLCDEECRVDFRVPDDVWQRALHVSQWDMLLCLSCFTRLADARFVVWAPSIKLYPCDLVTQIKIALGGDDGS